jgi:hypothetical protein
VLDRAHLSVVHDESPLTAAARLIDPGYRNTYVFQYESWQDELWDYLDTIGEFSYAHWWMAQAMSRVRPIAAEKIPGQNEPKPLETGPAADLANVISNSQLWEALGLHIPLVGKCFLMGRDEPLMGRQWSVRSADEIRSQRTGIKQSVLGLVGRARPAGKFQLQVEAGQWEILDNALVSEIRHPHPRYGWKSISTSKACIPILREISLYDKHIIATLVSRLAMNGIILFPEGMTFPVNEQFKDAPDPFIAQFADIAGHNIRNPGSAGAAIPIPIRVNEQYIDKIKHLTFNTEIDKRIIEARKDAITRLATAMNISRERLTGMGEVNHWGSWEIKEDEISMSIAPTAELICDALTKTYLRPMLAAAGQPLRTEAGNEIVIWYSTDELATKPDLSQNAQEAYDAGEISADAYRRYKGFEESDKPSKSELADIIMLRQALAPGAGPEYLEELTGVTIEIDNQQEEMVPTEEDQGTQESEGGAAPPEESTPDRRTAKPAPVPAGVDVIAWLAQQHPDLQALGTNGFVRTNGFGPVNE